MATAVYRARLGACGVLAAVFLCACGMYDYTIALPNGYRLVRLNADEVALVGPQGSISSASIDPTVDGYAVVGALVIGHASPPPDSSHARVRAPRKDPEFFIIDTRKETAWASGNREKWVASLRERGIADVPQLRQPSVWQSFF